MTRSEMRTHISRLKKNDEDQIMALLSDGKTWSERQLATGLGRDTVSICALERLAEAGKVTLAFGPGGGQYLCTPTQAPRGP